ncbi:GerAB/ArcD/ProY family transporter [Clostridium sp. 'White wine YQ']|uniref:GerAB/ArcD/ProY family transporter n=1 Tax=Clostridium sp. 'White wine YQ' TaxID=3027474 RepID=UPI00236636D2|nr:endospore germination permease [Clostridium sp. 'White wine YQ']MDD7795937.1 endospore germination permease [Clostridium sp. 'White wine YQ']
MQKISNYQLFCLMVLFEIGSTIIFGFASEAGRAAWISVLISAFIGLLINLLYLYLMKCNPELTLVEWFPKYFGKWIGFTIAWIYVLEFMYDGGRMLQDLEILVPTTILLRTPSIIVQLIFMIVIVYALYGGLEVIGRLGEIFLPVILLLSTIEILLILFSDAVHIQYLKPFLDKGLKNTLNSVFPLGITQTFGQTIEFTMIWPEVRDQNKLIKSTLLATLFSGIFIALLDVLAIMVVGATTFSRSKLPLYRLIRTISIGDFIENLDSINVLFFLTTAFFKLFIHVFCAIKGVQKLLYTRNKNKTIIPVSLIVFYLGTNMASSDPEHLETGLKIVPYNLWFPLFYIIPILLFVFILIKKFLHRKVFLQ